MKNTNFETELEIFLQVYKTDKFDDWASGRIEGWEEAAKQGDISAAKMVAMDVHQCLYGLYEGDVETFGVSANMRADMIPAFKQAASNGCTEAVKCWPSTKSMWDQSRGLKRRQRRSCISSFVHGPPHIGEL